MTEIEMAGCEIEILRRERDLLILAGGMRDSFKIDDGMRNKKQKITRYGRYAENCDSNQVGKDSQWGGMTRLSQK